ncbi:biofilm regulation diguanylate cyclase SiaD [Pararhodospirillum oryzae]|uniref:diguanylate cyclase n=1 Tax=Pararhodospirillum oryzae TaxID=478448 RepID=A0A512H4U5_9PROT|nr:biofilm regulation diguanylate cyclase SiaD [Pararhodospirillum oryzae]GEO80461.1 GGDEF domain-containing protein [Pararhodospirillum oryzae]
MTVTEKDLEARVEAALATPGQEDPWPLLAALFDRYRTQQRLLDRLTRISDQYQRAERDRGLSYADNYQRKVRQIEKIVRISDHYQAMLRSLNDHLRMISTHDDLTGLPNRRLMRERLAQEQALANRQDSAFSIALADIDRFKSVNDTWGHTIGDTVLARTANVLQDALRDYDVCARWGGEEFLLLFPSCARAEALRLAERLRTRVAEDPAEPPVTISLGVTEYRPGESLDDTLRRADAALYQAKDDGRNRVAVG